MEPSFQEFLHSEDPFPVDKKSRMSVDGFKRIQTAYVGAKFMRFIVKWRNTRKMRVCLVVSDLLVVNYYIQFTIKRMNVSMANTHRIFFHFGHFLGFQVTMSSHIPFLMPVVEAFAWRLILCPPPNVVKINRILTLEVIWKSGSMYDKLPQTTCLVGFKLIRFSLASTPRTPCCGLLCSKIIHLLNTQSNVSAGVWFRVPLWTGAVPYSNKQTCIHTYIPTTLTCTRVAGCPWMGPSADGLQTHRCLRRCWRIVLRRAVRCC